MLFVLCLLLLADEGTVDTHVLEATRQLARYQDLAAKNPSATALMTEAQAHREQGRAALGLPDPSLSFSFFARSVETRVGPQRARFGAGQTFVRRDKRANRQAVHEAMAESALLSAATLERGLKERIHRQFGMLYLIGRSLDRHREHQLLLKDLEEVLTEKYKTSEADYADLIRVQIEQEKVEDQLAGYAEQAVALRAAMNGLMNRAPDQPIPFPKALPTVTPAQSSLAGHPALSRFDSQKRAARLEAEAAELSLKPDLNLGFEWIFTGDAADPLAADSGKDALMVKLGVQLPVRKRAVAARKRSALYREDMIAQQQQAQKLELTTAKAQAESARNDAQRRIRLYRDRILPKAEEALVASLSAFQAGRMRYADLIAVEEELLFVQLSLDEARVDLFNAEATLVALLGEGA